MELHQIALPEADNLGQSYLNQIREWESIAIDKAGGFTLLEASGGYRHDNGLIQREGMRLYQVMASHDDFAELIRVSFQLFPDQTAIFVARIGTAGVYKRVPEMAA